MNTAGEDKLRCADCIGACGKAMPSLGREDMVSHFDQNPGERLRRIKHGHFGEFYFNETTGEYEYEEQD